MTFAWEESAKWSQPRSSWVHPALGLDLCDDLPRVAAGWGKAHSTITRDTGDFLAD